MRARQLRERVVPAGDQQDHHDRRPHTVIARTHSSNGTGFARELGFTLIELMVGIALGLLVIGIVTGIFLNVSANRRDMERAGRQIENGRYALQLLNDDLINAGKNYVYLALGSGDREQPLETQYPYRTPVLNRFYVAPTSARPKAKRAAIGSTGSTPRARSGMPPWRAAATAPRRSWAEACRPPP